MVWFLCKETFVFAKRCCRRSCKTNSIEKEKINGWSKGGHEDYLVKIQGKAQVSEIRAGVNQITPNPVAEDEINLSPLAQDRGHCKIFLCYVLKEQVLLFSVVFAFT